MREKSEKSERKNEKMKGKKSTKCCYNTGSKRLREEEKMKHVKQVCVKIFLKEKIIERV